jgi:DNA-binding NarL/FixJ family response regulator
MPDATRGSIEVLLADSSPLQLQLLTSALRRRPEFRLRSCPLEVDPVFELLTQSPADVAVLALNRSTGESPDLTLLRCLHLAHPATTKILLVDSCDRDLVVSAFRSGARGLFCFADSPFRALCKCIQVVHRGQIWATAEQVSHLINVVTQVPSLRVVNANDENLLTPREEQVVALVAEGFANREIALELGLSEHTIKKYIFRIFDKLGISTRVELVLYAVSHGEHRSAEWLPGNA